MRSEKSEVRKKREIEIDDVCTGLDFVSIFSEAVADISMDVNAFPGISSTIGLATSCLSAVSHMTKGGTEMTKEALGCDDIPFDEIKDIIMAKYGKASRKMEVSSRIIQNMAGVATQAFNLVEKTKLEMRRGFKRVMNEVKDATVKEKINQISNFAEYFSTESIRINALTAEEFVVKLEEEDSILHLLRDSRTPKVDSLYTAMNDIILNDEAIPKNENDSTAFQALFALFYGAQTYVGLLEFLVNSNSFLADYYYQNGDYEKFNEQIDVLGNILDDFKSSLLDDDSGLLDKLEKVLDKVQNKAFIKKVQSGLYKQVVEKTKLLAILKSKISQINLSIIDDIPDIPFLKFEEPFIFTPVGEWKEGAVVKYAAQYVNNGHYSKLSDWSDPLIVRNKALPVISTTQNDNRSKYIFRKFNDDPPELVYKMRGGRHKFRDQFRDYYNAAGYPDTDLGFEEAKRVLLCCGSLVSTVSFEFGRTTFHNEAKSDNVKLFEYLKRYGSVSYADIKDDKGFTPLHVAAENGSSEMVRILLFYKAKANAATYAEGYTPLHLAVLRGMTESVKLLVNHPNVNVNAGDKNGFTPLHLSVNGEAGILRKLLSSKKINLNAQSKTGLTISHLAAIKGDYEIFKILKKKANCNLNQVDMNNLTPLHYAAMMGYPDMVGQMLSEINNLEVNQPGMNNKWTPLHYAIFFKKSDVALELINHPKTNVNSKASNDVSPLHMAASTGQDEIVEALLNKKANKDAKTKEGDTPLHLAAVNNCELCAKHLIDKGALINVKNKKNETPVDLASKFGGEDLAKYLKSKTGKRFRKYLDFDAKANSNKSQKLAFPAIQSKTSCNQPNCRLQLQLGIHDNESIAKPFNFSFDGNGTLLLLDLLLKKITSSRDKYHTSLSGLMSEMEAQLKALDLTEKFEKFLSLLSDVPVDEQVDLVEVTSRLKKAFMGNRGQEVVGILCSFAETVNLLNPGIPENLMEKFIIEKMFVNDERSKESEELTNLMKKTCVL